MKELIKEAGLFKILLIFITALILNTTVYIAAFLVSKYISYPISIEKVETLGIYVIILFFINLICHYLYNANINPLITRMQLVIERRTLKKVMHIRLENIPKIHSGHLTDILTSYSHRCISLIFDVLEEYILLIAGVFSFIYMTFKQSKLVTLISLGIMTIAIIYRVFALKKRDIERKAYYDSEAEYAATFVDFVSNVITVDKLKSFSFATKKLEDKKQNIMKRITSYCHQKAKMGSIFELLTTSILVLVIAAAADGARRGIDPMPFLLFYVAISETLNTSIRHAASSIEHFFEYRSIKNKLDETIGEVDNRTVIRNFKKLEINDGMFYYKEKGKKFYIPKFELNKGDKICITGESGQGKSTLLNILFGVYDLKEGNIVVDNKKVLNRKLDAVFISQDVEVFDLSIRDNLTLGANISDEKIIELFSEVGLKAWYDNLPNGLDELIGEKGIKISVGQKQRLNIIRGILRNRELYFIDEPTSNLDALTEEEVVAMLKKHLKDKTYIIVTHKEALKSICNKKYVVNNHTLKLEGK